MAAAVASARWHPHNASQLLTVSRLKQHQRKAQTMLSMRPARPSPGLTAPPARMVDPD